MHLRLPRLPAAAFAAVAANELVAQRAAELRAAALQEEGRQAAQMGDWGRVQELLRELRALAEGNAWLTRVRRAARSVCAPPGDPALLEGGLYKAGKMRSRLAARDEGAAWSVGMEQAKPSYLRRKPEQGKRLDDPDRDKSGSAK